MISRTPFAYQRRKQIRSLNWPTSRFSVKKLLVHQYSVEAGHNPAVDKPLGELIAGEGNPPPDRVILNDWTPPQVSEEESGT